MHKRDCCLQKQMDQSKSRQSAIKPEDRLVFFLHINTFDEDFERMTAAGVQFEESPHKEPYGQVAVFQDPFGNHWDLLQLSS